MEFLLLFRTKMFEHLIGTLAFLVITGNLRAGAISIKTNVSEPCHYFDTVPIDVTNIQYDNQTGTIYTQFSTFENIQYGWYDYVYVNGRRMKRDPYLRGCLCRILEGTCFRICQENNDPKTPITAAVGKKFKKLTGGQLVYGQPCANMHPVNENVVKLQKDGTLYDSEHEISINQEFYCLNVDKNVVVSTLICDPGKCVVYLHFNASFKFTVCRTPQMSLAPNDRNCRQRLPTIAK
jgi:Methuselah N-terminus